MPLAPQEWQHRDRLPGPAEAVVPPQLSSEYEKTLTEELQSASQDGDGCRDNQINNENFHAALEKVETDVRVHIQRPKIASSSSS
ncbi:hypothetical protein LEMLEM_LOCUS20760 [Lemmus lemmus]